MTNVVNLVTKHQEASENVVSTLRNMLELAERGGVVGVAVAAYDTEGYTHTAYESGENLATLVGALERVKYRILKHQDQA